MAHDKPRRAVHFSVYGAPVALQPCLIRVLCVLPACHIGSGASGCWSAAWSYFANAGYGRHCHALQARNRRYEQGSQRECSVLVLLRAPMGLQPQQAAMQFWRQASDRINVSPALGHWRRSMSFEQARSGKTSCFFFSFFAKPPAWIRTMGHNGEWKSGWPKRETNLGPPECECIALQHLTQGHICEVLREFPIKQHSNPTHDTTRDLNMKVARDSPHSENYVAARPRSRSEGAIRATITRTPSASSLLHARRAAFPSADLTFRHFELRLWVDLVPGLATLLRDWQADTRDQSSVAGRPKIRRSKLFGEAGTVSTFVRGDFGKPRITENRMARPGFEPRSSHVTVCHCTSPLVCPYKSAAETTTSRTADRRRSNWTAPREVGVCNKRLRLQLSYLPGLRLAAMAYLMHLAMSPLSLPHFSASNTGVVVTERFDCSPPTEVNRVEFSAGSLPDFRKWESWRTMPLVGGFSRGSLVSPAFAFWRCSIVTSFHPRRLSRSLYFPVRIDDLALERYIPGGKIIRYGRAYSEQVISMADFDAGFRDRIQDASVIVVGAAAGLVHLSLSHPPPKKKFPTHSRQFQRHETDQVRRLARNLPGKIGQVVVPVQACKAINVMMGTIVAYITVSMTDLAQALTLAGTMQYDHKALHDHDVPSRVERFPQLLILKTSHRFVRLIHRGRGSRRENLSLASFPHPFPSSSYSISSRIVIRRFIFHLVEKCFCHPFRGRPAKSLPTCSYVRLKIISPMFEHEERLLHSTHADFIKFSLFNTLHFAISQRGRELHHVALHCGMLPQLRITRTTTTYHKTT
ncbi:hypothetical protein PR048_009506 [Dryococelus australis]|uniref:Uncharacterized protein n=1 Tax=Dryococelus australis TaxID=614101 RepID=A0ABQ9I0U3_9NEOP|nr:hypothetical protein PR048_009506 [Dryococelus australis]